MKMKAGDLIKVSRKNKDSYQYGILVGTDEVIYLLEEKNSKGRVVKSTLKEFKKKNGSVEIVELPEIKNGKTTFLEIEDMRKIKNLIFEDSWSGWFMSLFSRYGIYTRKETLHRAKTNLGKVQLATFNNSEHFGLWCKIALKREDMLTEKVDKIYNPKVMQPRFPLPKRIKVDI